MENCETHSSPVVKCASKVLMQNANRRSCMYRFRESPLRNTATGAIWSPTSINSVPAQPIIAHLSAGKAGVLPPPNTTLSRFRINVVQLSGRKISLACSRTTTIKEIKTRYLQQLGGRRPAFDSLNVLYDGSRLPECGTLG